MEFIWSVFFIFISLVGSLADGQLIPTLRRCSLTQPDLDNCLRDAAQETVPYMADGIPSIGLLPLDPLKVDDVNINKATLKFSFSQPYILGLKSCKINKFHIDQDKNQIHLDYTKNGSFVGKYKINGQILILPISGDGDSDIKFLNLRYNFKIDYDPIVKDGKTYFKIKQHKLSYSADKVVFKMSNLFNGNKQLADVTTRIVNENWRTVFDEQSPEIMTKVGKSVVRIIKKLFLGISIEDMFKP